jgi:phosphoglycolate phosphatase-like HAD superfamily hydrolase
MIKTVIFDWNGTLIADTTACMAADNHVLKTFGGKPVNLSQYRDTIVIPAITFYSIHGCKKPELEKNPEKIGKVFHSFYEPRVNQIRTRKGAKILLTYLKKNHINSIILSNHTIDGIEKQLKKLNLEKFFIDLLANSTVDASMKKRNKKEKLIDYLQQKNLNPTEAIIIGDSPEEVEIGKSLSVKTISITNGYYATHRLKKANPNYIVNNLNSVINIIKKNI